MKEQVEEENYCQSEICKRCKDRDWCINHRQITIDELKEKDNDELMERDRPDRPGNI